MQNEYRGNFFSFSREGSKCPSLRTPMPCIAKNPPKSPPSSALVLPTNWNHQHPRWSPSFNLWLETRPQSPSYRPISTRAAPTVLGKHNLHISGPLTYGVLLLAWSPAGQEECQPPNQSAGFCGCGRARRVPLAKYRHSLPRDSRRLPFFSISYQAFPNL